MAYKHPPKGYVINDGDYGTIFIGSDKDTKVDRNRQIEIHSASDGCLKFYEDGGFELQSQSTSQSDNFNSNGIDGLFIGNTGKGIFISAPKGAITFKAREIRFESTSSEDPVVIRGSKVTIEADDIIKLDGSIVAVGARTRMLFRSPGSIIINSSTGVSIVEPKISLCPADLLTSVVSLMTNVFGY